MSHPCDMTEAPRFPLLLRDYCDPYNCVWQIDMRLMTPQYASHNSFIWVLRVTATHCNTLQHKRARQWVTQFIHMSTKSHMKHMTKTHSYVCRDSFIFVIIVYLCESCNKWESLIFGTWCIHMCEHVWMIGVSSLIHLLQLTNPPAAARPSWYDSLICVMWHWYVSCDIDHWYVSYDSFICVMWHW